MIDISEEFYRSLELPFRVVDVVSGELNDAAARKYDLEAWYPSQQRYRELVSVSNCTDYQSRLLKVQYHDQNNKLQYPHMLNGTLVAIQRTLTCLLENYHRGEFIEVPTVLQAYMQTDKIYPFP
jgi:seryl-tRNA synthetase